MHQRSEFTFLHFWGVEKREVGVCCSLGMFSLVFYLFCNFKFLKAKIRKVKLSTRDKTI